ncbi:MAG: PAS domain-containing protein [Candidatus Izemoplasmatales bacterium]|nr:PAS domain-containing protein [Candidatus Izemoplasmatales bacterium]
MEVFKYNASRVNRINSFMKELLDIKDTFEKVSVYKKYEKDILELNPIDIFYLDFYRDDTSLSISEIKDSANRFVNVFHKGITKFRINNPHPIFKELLSESKRIENHLAKIKPLYQRGLILNNREELLKIFERCFDFKLKFEKFQNIIFSEMEKVAPSKKPLEVLWELHDDSETLLKHIISMIKDDFTEEDELIKVIGNYHYLIFGINQKEEIILLPVMSQLLEVDVLDKMYNECINLGFVFSNKKLERIENKENNLNSLDNKFVSKTGQMSIKQLILMLNHLPFDITYVDEFDKVLYYNDSKKRHFPRTPAVIGRLVKNCHPPKSVHIVEGIIEDFKNNIKDYEDFWINFKGDTLYIAYYAVRDEDGNYKGVLEVSQNITKFKELEGEKRLRD